MNILSVENISKTLNDAPLFENLTFGLEERDRLGIVGHNGVGKSTLLKVISGQLEPDEGKISMNSIVNLSLLQQHIEYGEGDTVRDYFFESTNHRVQMLKKYYTSSYSQTLFDRLEKENCWQVETDFESMLGELGLVDILDQKMEELSGGMQKKIAIAKALCTRPNLLLLDEPTNHLDIETIEWLEKYLLNNNITLILITHDRYFLDNVCTSIMEIDRSSYFMHPGNYTEYLDRREKRIEDMQKYQDKLTTILRRELKWLERAPKARGGKDTGRKDRIQSMLSQRENVQDVAQTGFSSNTRRLGKKILEIEHISKSYDGRKIIDDFSYSFVKGTKIGVTGPNGCGKSTLLDLLTGTIAPDSGSVDIGVNTVFGYYDQTGRDLVSDKTVLEYMEEISDRITLSSRMVVTAARFLEMFSFPSKFHRLPISTLSGGERRRLYLISQMIRNPNFLILDEPTNDLDLQTIENLEQYIDDFEGCVLIVSHDRAFLDQCCDYMFYFDEGKIRQFAGTYTLFREQLDQKRRTQAASKPAEEKKAPPRTENRKKGLSFKEKKEYEELMTKMDETSETIAELEKSFASIETDRFGTLAERSKLYEKLKQELDRMETRWLELEELQQQ